MADPEHVRRAGYAIAAWNRWRDENPDVVPDLSGANLSAGLYRKGKLFGANLSGADLRRSNLSEADFHASNLSGADLSKTNLSKANLNNAILTSAELAKAVLKGASLREADLNGADLEKADLSSADLTGATLKGTKLIKTNLQSVTGLTQAQVDEALGDATTDLPAGIRRPSAWGVTEDKA